jgi:hypothetical protein
MVCVLDNCFHCRRNALKKWMLQKSNANLNSSSATVSIKWVAFTVLIIYFSIDDVKGLDKEEPFANGTKVGSIIVC